MVRPQDDDRVVGEWAVVERVEQAADHVVAEADRRVVGLDRLLPFALLNNPAMPLAFGHCLAGFRNVAEVVLDDFRQFDLVKRMPVVVLAWRVPGDVWPVDADTEEERRFVFDSQMLLSPRNDLRVGHLVCIDIERRPVEKAVVEVLAAIDGPALRPAFGMDLVGHLAVLRREVLVPWLGIDQARVERLRQRRGVVEFAAATRFVAVEFEVLGQRDDVLELLADAPVLVVVVHARRRRREARHHARARRIAGRRRAVGVRKQYAALRQPVDVRSDDRRLPVHLVGAAVQVVDGDEQHIRS